MTPTSDHRDCCDDPINTIDHLEAMLRQTCAAYRVFNSVSTCDRVPRRVITLAEFSENLRAGG